jgi:ribosomal protein S18 acetylase RimI-like enzyme/predicted double-glycine peptidase
MKLLAKPPVLPKTSARRSRASRPETAEPRVRLASARDIPELVRIENAAFDTDRLNAQSLRNFIKSDTASVHVAQAGPDEVPGTLHGFCIVLFRRGTVVARLYSMAVDHGARGRGVAQALMRAMETDAAERGSMFLRLEVRHDNTAAIRLYESFGYKPFGRYLQYYEDNADALRFEKSLLLHADASSRRVPYYSQTTDFTCGPAAMMMAMSALDDRVQLSRRLELKLWREATTIVMTTGVGGCDPAGMAVALGRRGFRTSVHMTQVEPLFLDTVRSAWKRDVMTVTQEDFRVEAREMKIPIRIGALKTARLKTALEEGAIAIVLISPYRLYHERVPHWIVAYDVDDRHVFIHDPWLDTEQTESPINKAALAIPLKEFERISVYGKARLRAAVVVEASPKSPNTSLREAPRGRASRRPERPS